MSYSDNSNSDQSRSQSPYVPEQDNDKDHDGTEHNECPECHGSTQYEDDQVICSSCGLVISEDRLTSQKKFIDFSDDSPQARTGSPITETHHDKGLSTNIDWKNKDAHGNPLSQEKRQKMNRLRTWNERYKSQDGREQGLKYACGEIQRIATALTLPHNVEETACALHRRIAMNDMLPGRSIDIMAGACVYIASRQCDVPRSLDEVAAVTRLDEAVSLQRHYSYVVREFSLKIKPTKPESFLPRTISELPIPRELEQEIEQIAESLLNAAREQNLHSGKSPTSLAGASVYAATLIKREEIDQINGERITQDGVSDVVDVSTVTIRNRYYELMEAHPKYSP